MVKILRYFVYACAFVPLIIFNDYISPFHFGKVVIFRSLVEIMLVFYLLLIWKNRSYWQKFNIITWSFLAFAVAFSVTSITSIIPYASVWGSLERMGGVFTFWHYFVFFIMLTAVFRTEKDWFNLLNLSIAIGILSAFYGFGQRFDIGWIVGSGGRSRIFGTIGNPALFAGYQIVNLFLALTLFFRPKISQNFKIFYALAVVINTIAVMMTAVRGSILAIGVGFLCFSLLYTSAYHSRKAKNILLGLIGIMVLFVLTAIMLRDTSFIQSSGYLKRITSFNLTDYTVQTRFWAWEAGFKGWKETPKTILFGWGPENFNIPFSKYFNPKFFQGPGSETLFDRAHNMFVEILVTMGLLGLLTYLGIFAAAFKVLWKKVSVSSEGNFYGVGFISLLIAYAIHNSFIFDTSANFIIFFTVLGFIHFISFSGQEMKQQRSVRTNPAAMFFAGVIMLIVATVFVYKINVLPAKANYTTTRAIIIGWQDDFAGAVKKYEEAVSYDVPGKYEIRNRFAQYVLEKTNSGKMTPEYAEAIFKAIKEVEKNVNENPQDYLPLLYESRLYIILGKEDSQSEYNDKALEYSTKALEIAPTFVRTYYEIGQAYLNKKDYDNAAKSFQKAAELNPEVGLSYWYWGVVEIERGNVGLGLEIIEKIISQNLYSPAESDMMRLASIYLKINQLDKLIWISERLVESKPENPQYRASLAVSYVRVGRIDDAVIQAKKAAELDPQFEAEARAFVQSLGRQW